MNLQPIILYVGKVLMLRTPGPYAKPSFLSLAAILLLLFSSPLALGAQTEEAKKETPPAAKTAEKAPYSPEEWKRKREDLIRKQNNRDGELRFRYAHMLFSESYYARARELWRRFMALFPSHPLRINAMRYLALIAEKEGRYMDAMNMHIHTYQESPSQDLGIRSYLQAGRLAARLGKIDRAKRIFKELVKRRKTSHLAKMAQIELDALLIDDTEI